MAFEYEPLKLLSRRRTGVPKQKVSSNNFLNEIITSCASGIEKYVLKINKGSFSVEELRCRNPAKIRFKEMDELTVLRYSPKRDSNSAVIVLPQRGGGYNFAQLISSYFACNGLVAYEVETPLRSSRFPKGVEDVEDLSWSLSDFKNVFSQAIREVRGLVGLIGEKNVGICGISFGAIYSSIVYGTDDRFSSAGLILGGGDLVSIIMNSNDRFAKAIKKSILREEISEEGLRENLKELEPCNNVDLIKSKNLLMINATYDRDVPVENGEILKKAWEGSRECLIDTSHKTSVRYAPRIISMLSDHFNKTLN